MASVPFDTLELARRLEAAGFPAKQAQDVSAALASTMAADLITRADLAPLATKADLAETKADLLRWMVGLLLGQAALVTALVRLL